MNKASKQRRFRTRRWFFLPAVFVLGSCGLCLAALLVYQLPPVHDRLGQRVANLEAEIQRLINPPEELVFVPKGAGAAQTAAAATLAGMAKDRPTITPTGSLPAATRPPDTPTPTGTVAPTQTPTPTVQPTPLPAKTLLQGVIHEYQQFNNCGPTNLAMALSFWGWQGDQRDTRSFLRPNLKVDDKNVMPSEMVAYVRQFTGLHALTRVGGDVDLLRRLIAAGFPVIVEAGHDPPDDWWMGHYLVINGYDDALQMFTVQDSLANPDQPMSYAELEAQTWRDFNYVYVLIYPPERQAEALRLLGVSADVDAAFRLAETRALEETANLSGRDQFFAFFNLGSSRVGLQDYAGAAQAYDQAFELYGKLPEDLRSYRLMWYQVGPYTAYYQTGRYQDVISLANTTFQWVGKPVLEESYYWRGMAYLALGQTNPAIADLTKAATLNPNYAAPRYELALLGVSVP